MPNVCCCLMKRKHSERSYKISDVGEAADVSNDNDFGDEQEILLGLGNVTTCEDIPEAVRTLIRRVLPDSHSISIQWKNEPSQSCQSLKSNGWMGKNNLPKTTQILSRKEMQLDQYSDLFEQENLDNYGVFFPLCSHDQTGNNSKYSKGPQAIFLGFATLQINNFGGREKKLVNSIENQIELMFKRFKSLESVNNTNTTTTNNNIELSIKFNSRDIIENEQEFTASPNPELGQKILCLCANLYDRDPGILQVKIIKFLKENIQLESAFILTISPNTLELICQAQDEIIFNPEKRIRINNSIFESIINEKKCAQLVDFTNLENVNSIESFTGTKWRSFLCVPILSQNQNVTALVCLINKIGADNFTKEDINMTKHVFRYTAAVLTSSVAFHLERKLKVQTETMLQVAMNIFRKLDDLTVLLKEIMNEAKKLTEAERCSVFLVEKDTSELVAKVFDGLPAVSDSCQQPKEIRIPLTQGVAGHVASTGQMINITDAYSHPLFYRRVDAETGYKTRNILCFPIKDENEEVVGVAQLCNKVNGPYFTVFDEEVAISFSVYCGISIMHSLMYKKVQDSQHRNKLANELMTYHMQVNEENVFWLTTTDIPNLRKIKADIDSFQSLPREIEERDSLLSVLGMINELGFISKYRMNRKTMARFILMVKKGYRDPPYHNWTHAFTVAHFVYLCLNNLSLSEKLLPIEQLALFVASLCHDIDHRGTNNSFQVNSNSVLAALYSSEGSVLERHHFSQTVCILNSEGCNIFENLSRQDYQHVLDLIRDIILATDLAQHLRIIDEQRQMISVGYDATSDRHHTLLLDLLMTCSDLSDQSKNWKNTRAVAELIYEEFFTQGDLEKASGHKPAEQMDRERACVPSLQISFLDGIAAPCFQMFADFFPDYGKDMMENIRKNRSIWQKLNEEIKNGKISANIFQLFHKDISPSGSLASI